MTYFQMSIEQLTKDGYETLHIEDFQTSSLKGAKWKAQNVFTNHEISKEIIQKTRTKWTAQGDNFIKTFTGNKKSVFLILSEGQHKPDTTTYYLEQGIAELLKETRSLKEYTTRYLERLTSQIQKIERKIVLLSDEVEILKVNHNSIRKVLDND